MFGYLDFLFLSFRGRIGRAALWLGCIVIGLAQIAGSFRGCKLRPG